MEDHIEHQQEVLQLLKENLTIAQNRMKQQVDQHHSKREFEVARQRIVQPWRIEVERGEDRSTVSMERRRGEVFERMGR